MLKIANVCGTGALILGKRLLPAPMYCGAKKCPARDNKWVAKKKAGHKNAPRT
jgi:hypothetical protein